MGVCVASIISEGTVTDARLDLPEVVATNDDVNVSSEGGRWILENRLRERSKVLRSGCGNERRSAFGRKDDRS